MNCLSQDSIAAFEVRYKQCIAEMDSDIDRVNNVKESAVYLRNQAIGAQRTKDMKDRYQKAKQAEALKTFGGQMSKILAGAIFEETINPVPEISGTDAACDHSAVMVFSSVDGSVGCKISDAINDYQRKSAQSVECKLKSLTDFLSRNKDRVVATSPVKHLPDSGAGSAVPDLSDVLQLVSPLEYEDQPGTSPWLVSIRPEKCASSLTSGFPMPGLAAIVRLAPGSEGPVSFLLTPVKALLEAGLTILSDFSKFANNDGGLAVVDKTSLFVTLEKPEQMLWVPMGFIPTVVGRLPYENVANKKEFLTSTFWVKTIFCKHLATAVPHPEWVSIQLLNQPYLQNLSGQKLFKQRLQTFERLCNDRSALQLGFDVPTLMDADADTIIAGEISPTAAVAPAPAPGKEKKVAAAPALNVRAAANGSRKALGQSAKCAAKSAASKPSSNPRPKAGRSSGA